MKASKNIATYRRMRTQPLWQLLASDTGPLERIREIITLADDLASDFRRVRDHFDTLNRDLRERILDSDGKRGSVDCRPGAVPRRLWDIAL